MLDYEAHSPPRTLPRLLAACLAVALAGCAPTHPTRDPPVEPVFPLPPGAARLVFERSVLSAESLLEHDAGNELPTPAGGTRVYGHGFGRPFDVAACEGVIYVSDPLAQRVLVFDVARRRSFGIGVDEPGALIQPLGLDTDGRCNLYVADASLEQVLVYARDGRFLRAVGGPDLFDHLSHVAVTADGARLYAVDTGHVDNDAHRLRVFDAVRGTHLHDIGRHGDRPGEFDLPQDVEVGADGTLFVVDGANFRVQMLSANGEPRRTFGSAGRQPGQFSRPHGIAVDPDGLVYVSDTAFGNFQVFTPAGRLLMFVGTRDVRPGPAHYMLPAGIDVDEDGRVLVVDQFFRKIDVYRPVGLAPDAGFLGTRSPPAADATPPARGPGRGDVSSASAP